MGGNEDGQKKYEEREDVIVVILLNAFDKIILFVRCKIFLYL